MLKQRSTTFFGALLLCLIPWTAAAQCTNNNTLTGLAVTVACPGNTSVVCVQAGQYALVNVTLGNVYTFGVCTAGYNTMITLFNNTGGGNVGFNNDGCNSTRSVVRWTATFTGQLRVLVDRNTCTHVGGCSVLDIACGFPDEPCTATALAVNASCVNTTHTNVGATSSAGIPPPGCGIYAGGDVWFTAVVPATGGITVTGSAVGGSAFLDGDMAIYSAPACGGAYTLLGCDNNSAPGTWPTLTVTCRTPGEVLYIRFWEYGNDEFGEFNICAQAIATPANDDACAATTLLVGNHCATGLGSLAAATGSAVAAPSCANYLGRDVWYQLIVPPSGNVTVTTSTVGGSAFTDGGLAIYSATNCALPATFVQLACNDDIGGGNLMSSITLTGQTPGQTLYVRVWSRGNTTCGAFSICASSPNDDSCTARPLAVGGSCSYSLYSNAGYTLSSGVAAPDCGNLTGSSIDVWFSFIAPASGVAIIQSTAGTLSDGAMALYYAASCTAASLTLVDCNDDDGINFMPFLRFVDLVPGGTYYLRYWGYGSATGSFNLCVWSPAYNVGNCSYLLEMYDSGENGWGSSAVQIQLDAGPITSYTVTAAYNAVTFAVNIGQILYVSYVNTGPNQSQNRFFLRQVPSGNGVFLAGPSPPSGLLFFESIDCVPPPSPAEDCRGAVAICNAQSFSNNATGTGFDVDLRPATYGCLTAAERQGTWYKFSPSAGGTIGMTIAPIDATDDYDFAIWGPYVSVTCPPNTAPTRCSFSLLSGNTGMGNGAVDTSEDPSGDKWVDELTVITGEIYLLYISNYSQSGLAFDLSWQLSGGASLDCTILPVELIALEAKSLSETIEVTWTTGSEVNSDHFSIERSADMIVFEAIGTVPAAGTSASPTDYVYVDEAPNEGLNYYRLQQVDEDGSSTTSQSVYAVYRRASTEMVVFPNPAGDILYASFELPEDDAVIYRVLDASGRLVEQDLYHGTKGNMLIDIPLDRLPAGSYILLVNDSFGALNGSAHFIRE